MSMQQWLIKVLPGKFRAVRLAPTRCCVPAVRGRAFRRDESARRIVPAGRLHNNGCPARFLAGKSRRWRAEAGVRGAASSRRWPRAERARIAEPPSREIILHSFPVGRVGRGGANTPGH